MQTSDYSKRYTVMRWMTSFTRIDELSGIAMGRLFKTRERELLQGQDVMSTTI